MIDIHAHVLDGVDDGSKNMDMSLDLLRLAAASCTTDIIATPHIIEGANHLPWDEIKQKTEILNRNAQSAGIPIRVHTGAEIELNLDMLDMIKNKTGDYCLANSSYILIELPMEAIPRCTDKFFYELQLRGLIPVLAHPERYSNLQKQPGLLLEWVKKGILTQCNAGSFTGMFGEKAQALAEILLTNNMVHFLGSDAHRMEKRNTDMSQAVAQMKTLVSELYVQQIISLNPQAILNNKIINMDAPEDMVLPDRGHKGFWGKLFN